MLYQVGHFYEIYDDDAQAAASFFGSATDFRTVPDGAIALSVCGQSAHAVWNHLREQFDLTISGIDVENRTSGLFASLR